MKKLALLLLILFISSFNVFSQHRNNASIKKEITTIHYYTFEANVSQDRLDALESALAKLEFVTEAKVKYKAEKGMGQVIMTTKQPEVTSENQPEFNPTSIKRTLISMGFSPVRYSVGESTTK